MFLFIILMNFFISMVSQKYEEQMSRSEIQEYDHRAEMNKEAYMFFEWYKYWKDKLYQKQGKGAIDCFIL